VRGPPLVGTADTPCVDFWGPAPHSGGMAKLILLCGALALVGCGDDGPTNEGRTDGAATGKDGAATGKDGAATGKDSKPSPPPPDGGPGNPKGTCTVPTEAKVEDSSKPKTVVGTGTKASCTAAAFVAAVAKGGVITFNCGAAPVTITLTKTAKVVNDTGPIVIDGGGKVTLSGGGKVRILYQNTCDKAQKWTTSKCNDQDHPKLTVQNLTFIKGNAKTLKPDYGGGAIYVRGGRFKIVNCTFYNNVCDDTGPDVGGAAVRVLDQHKDLPVYVVQSTFGGKAGLGNVCSNGGGLSSIGVSYTVLNSLFSHNNAIGNGANPAKAGTPGGGSGGAIYNDGNTFTLTLCGVKIDNNTAKEGGGAIFFVSNDRSGTLVIKDSTLTKNPSGKFETKGYPGIFYLGKGPPQVTNSTITK
jgi:predicted outer membrane repeat protein